MLISNQKLLNGRYTVISDSTQNGFGSIYKAFDNELQTAVLIKEIEGKTQKVATPKQLESNKNTFAQNAEQLRNIKHDSLLPIKNYFSDVSNHYLVFDSYEAKTLNDLLEVNKAPIPCFDVIKWADQLLDPLSVLHSKSPPLILKAIKPTNIFLNSDRSVRLSTVNIIDSDSSDETDFSDDKLFKSDILTFSPLEQLWSGLDSASKNVILNNFDEQSQKILEQSPDARSDLYSLGATIYYLVTATLPIDPISRLIDILDGNDDPLPSPHKLNSDITKEFSDFVMKSLELKREDRFNSAVIMRQVMRSAASQIKQKTVQLIDNVPTPPIIAEAKKPKPPVKKVVGEQKSQLELMKKQLREAEDKRKAAEQRAIEAERRLEKQKQLKAVGLDIVSKQPEAPTPKSEVLGNEKAQQATVIPTAMLSENKIAEDYISKEEKDTEYFADLYEEPVKESQSYRKYAAAAVVLFVLCGAVWGFWSFFGANNFYSEQVVTADESVPPVEPIEDQSEPTAEIEQNEMSVGDSEIESMPETEQQEEVAAPSENAINPAESQNAAFQNRPAVRQPGKSLRKSRRTVKRQPRRVIKRKPSKSKPPKAKKKTVTLDDLLNEN